MTLCQHWRPEELQDRAENLASILLELQGVDAVCLYGSLARMEPTVHDIDLLILHNGTLPTGSARDPIGWLQKKIDLKILLKPLYQKLARCRREVPINVELVDIRVLQACDYLLSLSKQEFGHPGFYRRVFVGGPIQVLGATTAAQAKLLASSCGQVIVAKGVTTTTRLLVGHRCGSIRCQPSKTWEEVKKIRLRKRVRKLYCFWL